VRHPVYGSKNSLASAHTALGQTFFSMTVVIALLSGRDNFFERQRPAFHRADRNVTVLAAISLGLLYVQLNPGAMFRHGGIGWGPDVLNSIAVVDSNSAPLWLATSVSAECSVCCFASSSRPIIADD